MSLRISISLSDRILSYEYNLSESEKTSPEPLSIMIDLTFAGEVWSTEMSTALNRSQMFHSASVSSGMNRSVIFLNRP